MRLCVGLSTTALVLEVLEVRAATPSATNMLELMLSVVEVVTILCSFVVKR